MRRDLIVALYFFFFTIVALLLTPPYLLAVMRLERILIGQDCDSWCLMNDNLPNLLITQRDFNDNLFLCNLRHDFLQTDLSSLGQVL